MTDKEDNQPEISPERASITLQVGERKLVITRDMTIGDLQKAIENDFELKQELDLLILHDAVFGTNLNELIKFYEDAFEIEGSKEDKNEYVRRNVINAIFDAFIQRNMIENTGNDDNDSKIIPIDSRPKE